MKQKKDKYPKIIYPYYNGTATLWNRIFGRVRWDIQLNEYETEYWYSEETARLRHLMLKEGKAE